MLCFHENKFEEAAGYMRNALAILKKILGDEHPHTKTVMENLAELEKHLQ
jgi:hypothetical protein